MNETDIPGLVDISTVAVDGALPDRERVAEYKRQLGDPHHYTSGIFSVTAVHPPDGESLESCLRAMMA